MPPANSAEDLKRKQDELNTGIDELEKALSELDTPTKREEHEVRKAVDDGLGENKKLSRKIDYLLNLLIDANESIGEDKSEEAMLSVAKTQLKILKELEGMKGALREMHSRQETLEREVTSVREKSQSSIEALIRSQDKRTDEFSKKLQAIHETISKLPIEGQVEALKKEMEAINASLTSMGSKPSTDPAVAKEISSLKLSVEMLRKGTEDVIKQMDNMVDKEDFSALHVQENTLRAMHNKIDDMEEKLGEMAKSVSSSGVIKSLSEMDKKFVRISNELKTLESLLTSSQPRQVTEKITALSDETKELKKALSSVDRTVQAKKSIPERAAVDSMRLKVNKVDERLSDLSRIARKRDFRPAESRIISEIDKLTREVEKMEAYSETYPVSEAQHLSMIKEKMAELEQVIAGSNDEKLKAAAKEHLGALRSKIDGMHSKISESQAPVHEPIRDHARELIGAQRKIADAASVNRDFERAVEGVHKEAQETLGLVSAGKPEGLPSRIGSLTKGISELEKHVERDHISEAHAGDIKANISEIHGKLGGNMVPEKVPEIRDHAANLGIAEHGVVKQETAEKVADISRVLDGLKKSLAGANAKGSAEMSKQVDGAKSKAEGVSTRLSEAEMRALETKEKLSKLNALIDSSSISGEGMLESYVKKMPLNSPQKLTEISGSLGIDGAKLKKTLIGLKKKYPGWFSLANIDYSSEMLGQEALILKLAERDEQG